MKTILTMNVPEAMMIAVVEAGLDQFAGLVGNGKVTAVAMSTSYGTDFKITIEVDLGVAKDTLLGSDFVPVTPPPAG